MSYLAVRTATVEITFQSTILPGDVCIPDDPQGLVVFAHGSGSSRASARNRFVAETLHRARLATLLFDLLTADEQWVDEQTRQMRFDIPLLAARLTGVVDWIGRQERLSDLPLGLYGASTGAAAALVTAADRPAAVGAVVGRGGRPDLAGDALRRVRVPVLLIVGQHDPVVMQLNHLAATMLGSQCKVSVVPEATHLFEEPGTLERAADLARDWFTRVLVAEPRT